MDGQEGALVSLGADLRLRGAKAREGCTVRSQGVWRWYSRKHTDAALLREEMACLDCLITNNRLEMGLERIG